MHTTQHKCDRKSKIRENQAAPEITVKSNDSRPKIGILIVLTCVLVVHLNDISLVINFVSSSGKVYKMQIELEMRHTLGSVNIGVVAIITVEHYGRVIESDRK